MKTIRSLLLGVAFVAATLAPPIAYAMWGQSLLAQNPALPPTSIACDVGPNYTGAIPGPALAMGFTTCLNLDFTYTGAFSNRVGFTNGSGTVIPAGKIWTWADKTSWLNTAGAAFPLFTYGNGGTDNNAFQIVNDGGTQALLSLYNPGDNSPQINSLVYPNTNAFFEEETRVDPLAYQGVTTASNGEVIADFGFFALKPDGLAALEIDSGITCGVGTPANWTAGTACSGNGSFVWDNTGKAPHGQPGFPPCCGINIEDGNYHTTAMLVAASRTNNTVAYCGYYDKQRADGKGFGPCWAPGYTNSGDACTFQTSVACYQMGVNSIGAYVTAATQVTARHWVRRITIWTCSGWNTPSGPSLNSCDSGNNVPSAINGSANAPSY